MRIVLFSLALVAFAFAASTSDVGTATSTAPVVKPKIDKPWWSNNPDTLTWTTIASLPTPVSRCGGAFIEPKYYNVCGEASGGLRTNKMQIWDGSAWSTSTASHPAGISNLSAAAVNGKVVVSGGSPSSGYYNFTSVYDPIAETWVQDTPLGTQNVIYPCYVGLGTKCYSFGGATNGSTANSDTWEWTPGDASMTAKAAMPAARCYLMGAAYNDKIYLFGGGTGGGAYAGTNTIWEFTPSTNTWVTKSATLATSRCWGGAATIGDKIYIVAGYSGGAYSNVVEIYDPVADTIAAGPPISFVSRSLGVGGGLDASTSNHTYTGTIVAAAGYSGTYVGSANEGAVTGITYTTIVPTSLGNIKASYK